MGDNPRFYVIRENHIGFGIRWECPTAGWKLALSFGIPFVSFVICFGKDKNKC
jgi:hypothetical protein